MAVFNLITRQNESRTLLKHSLCNYICKFSNKYVLQFKNEIKISDNMNANNQQKVIYAKKIIFGILKLGLLILINI